MSDPVADFLAREQDVLAGIDGAPLPAPAADSLPPTDNGSHFTRTSWNPAMFFTAPTDRPKCKYERRKLIFRLASMFFSLCFS